MIFLGYQLIRVAERMLMPRWLTSRENVDVMRSLLGVDTPADGATKTLKALSEVIEKVRKGE